MVLCLSWALCTLMKNSMMMNHNQKKTLTHRGIEEEGERAKERQRKGERWVVFWDTTRLVFQLQVVNFAPPLESLKSNILNYPTVNHPWLIVGVGWRVYLIKQKQRVVETGWNCDLISPRCYVRAAERWRDGARKPQRTAVCTHFQKATSYGCHVASASTLPLHLHHP